MWSVGQKIGVGKIGDDALLLQLTDYSNVDDAGLQYTCVNVGGAQSGNGGVRERERERER